ncbi:carboxylating nicotinate-nucleotide diphosphorylase [Weeksellaceae bacterium KMM 9713]|uniref:Probable nicotinate-nucleotide pyrophosphorylase [carboxylating] n=1 Tax=Profundicola chukchiensis TaxID=2961959 RepID=A0A9X4MWR9_9FLAO|nr:carboxylating nicotinate-nucleotide diphosphorylase [Profundicola chukchiensis]MDG4945528.1 carboxylating nicotinate-nucleotide diphosphorylase [Profundicola chukchiensis]
MERPSYITDEKLISFIHQAFREDVGDGDHSTLASIPYEAQNRARLLVKEDGILAGVELAEIVFSYLDPDLKFNSLMSDGDEMKVGDIAFTVEGSAQSILTAERLVLNIMQRMSGIATLANSMAKEVVGTNTKVLDTRKTTPNFRMIEKWAVVIGGAHNHRFGLYDMIMLKDNHIDYAGGIEKAVQKTRAYLKENNLNLKIEVETRNLEEVQQALDAQVDRIMIDNFSIEETKKAVDMIGDLAETEASGGITLETLREVAETGVDFISSGAIIHSAKNIDLSLKAF